MAFDVARALLGVLTTTYNNGVRVLLMQHTGEGLNELSKPLFAWLIFNSVAAGLLSNATRGIPFSISYVIYMIAFPILMRFAIGPSFVMASLMGNAVLSVSIALLSVFVVLSEDALLVLSLYVTIAAFIISRRADRK
ncbi:hypothetical protein ACYPKM_01860 [Pseudomonas aeruginosa]